MTEPGPEPNAGAAGLGRLAVRHGLLTRAQWARCLEAHNAADPPRPIERVLVEDGYLTASHLDLLVGLRERRAPPGGPDAAEARTVGRYRLLSVVGTGSLARVHRAVPLGGGSPAAVKLLGEGRASRPSLVREALACAARWRAISAPHVLPILAVIDPPPAIVLPFMGEGSAGDLLRRGGRLDPARAVALTRDAGLALAAAHAHDLVHGDVKPDNLLLDEEGRAWLTDFVGGKGRTATAAYLAPERWEGAPSTVASDLYALGATLWTLLTGEPPFGTAPREEMARRHREETPQLPLALVREIPLSATRLATGLLARAPETRPASARAAVDDLEALLQRL